VAAFEDRVSTNRRQTGAVMSVVVLRPDRLNSERRVSFFGLDADDWWCGSVARLRQGTTSF
jgi:hypothetical protein